ncbi:response regulator [Oceanidesulfovibrio marinus]|uniref:Response regulator n=1 Tax=Oceanidesulfovibrio marinus TaxID=370038 RepID=A0A6P1ZD90_9BACT|nr:response regulator [Oceanidesulfovibrio marinus]QJT09712.1 response regulator [Oceanidesulfovibrio marinus]TVM31525.1 response regulator [Oceanidesulfovibrio marinus]
MNKDNEKVRILILDDEPIVCKRLKPAFQKAGYDVETLNDSASAMARIEEAHFDVVITDLKMEGVDGMRFLTRIKEISPDTGVIVITGFATLDTAKESFRKGAFDFLAKPFKLSEILDAVKRVEAGRRQADSASDQPQDDTNGSA